MLGSNYQAVLSYFFDAFSESKCFGLVDDEALPLGMIRAIMKDQWGGVEIEFKWKPETFSNCSVQYRKQVKTGRFINDSIYDARLAVFAFLEENGFEVPCPFDSFIRKTKVDILDYSTNQFTKFGYWGMMSLALSRFEFFNNKFTVYLAVPPFMPARARSNGPSFFPDHSYLFGLESGLYSNDLQSAINQTDKFLRGQVGLDRLHILGVLKSVLTPQTRRIPLQFNVLPGPTSEGYVESSEIMNLSPMETAARRIIGDSINLQSDKPMQPCGPIQSTDLIQSAEPIQSDEPMEFAEPVKPQSFKRAKNQSERSKARKLKKRQLMQVERAAKIAAPRTVQTKPYNQPIITKDEQPAAENPSYQQKKRPKTHFRKTKKPGRA